MLGSSLRGSRSAFLLLIVSLCAVHPAWADDLGAAKPARNGLSPERLERLTDHMKQAVADGVMIGGVGLIARHGRVVYRETYGLADREANEPMTDDALFRIYSMSKPVTGVALMILYEEGRFFLNDPVARYLPELANLKVAASTADAAGASITSDGTTTRVEGEGDAAMAGRTRPPTRQPTIRDLLTHTAGFTYGVFGNTEVDQLYRKAGLLTEDMPLAQFVERLGEIPLQYDPGTRWHYSVAVDVQGRLVEVLSGMSLGEFMKKRIFEPLGMDDTSFVVADDQWDRVAQIYSPAGSSEDIAAAFQSANTSKELEVSPASVSEGYRVGAKFESGGGGLMSTADDYLRFCQMMLNGGELDGARVLSPKTVALMTTNNLGEITMDRPGVGFGLGFAVALNQGDIGEIGSEGTYNWGGAAGTGFWIDPQEELIGVFMVQSIPHRTRLSGEFRNLTYQAIVD